MNTTPIENCINRKVKANYSLKKKHIGIFFLVSDTRSRSNFNGISIPIANEEVPKDLQPKTTYIKSNWIVAEGTSSDLYEYDPKSDKDGTNYPIVQIASKRNGTTKIMSHSNEIIDVVKGIKTGKLIAVSGGSYKPVTKTYSVSWTLESEIVDQWMTAMTIIPIPGKNKLHGIYRVECSGKLVIVISLDIL